MMLRKILFFLLLFFSATFLLGQNKRAIGVDDYFAMKDISDARLSPDGKFIAYVVENTSLEKDDSFTNIFMIPFTGGAETQITFTGKDKRPRWSPDNKYLAFLSSRDKTTQVYLLNRNGGEALQLTDVAQGVKDFSWSPDSTKLALVITDKDPDSAGADQADDSGSSKAAKPYVITRLYFKYDEVGYLKELYKHIYIFDIGSKSLKQITSGPYDDASPLNSYFLSTPQWSPDGKQIVFVSNRTKDPDSNMNTDLFLISSDGGEPKQLTRNEGPDESPQWSPDGKYIAYQTSIEPKYLFYDMQYIAVVSATGGEPKLLTKDLDRNAWNAHLSKDGKRVFFILEDQGTQRLVSIPAAGGEVNRNVTPEKFVSGYDLGPNDSIALRITRPQLPIDLFASSGGTMKQLTHLNDDLMNSIELSRYEKVSFKSKDGTPLEGYITKPANFDATKQYPAILWIHGGPNEQEADQFDFRREFFAANGYVVLSVNYRGSVGYGKSFARSIFGDWGKKEVDDLMSGVDYAISQGYVDPDKLGVGGHSYGAILTNYMITATKRFKAAITDAGESNYFMNYGVDQYLLDWEAEVGKPWENPQKYLAISPYFHLANVSTPTLVICGQEDWNVPLINSEQLYQSLKRIGVETMLVVYPEQPHVFYRPTYIKDRNLRYLAWFDHFVKGTGDKVPESH